MAQPRSMLKYESKNHPGFVVDTARSAPDTKLLLECVKAFNPYVIVEFGYGSGGFTMAMHETCPKAHIKSFDVRKLPVEQVMDRVSGRVSFISDSILEGSSVARRALAWGQRTFLYCDNGFKTQEVLMYAALLRKGDMLGVHDYTVKMTSHPGVCSAFVDQYVEALGFVAHKHEEFAKDELRSRLWIREEMNVFGYDPMV